MAQVEINPFCRSILERHWPDVLRYNDVTKFCRRIFDCEPENEDGEIFCPRCGIDFGDCECIGTDQFTDECGYPDVLTAGVPCQPASLIGKRLGAYDSRWLWPDTLRITEQLTPAWCIFENPSAIITLGGGKKFAEILASLSEIGYDVWGDCIPAYAIGAGHRRERVFLVAAYRHRTRLERHSGHEKNRGETEPHRPIASKNILAGTDPGQRWYSQSGIQPVVNGFPGRVDMLKAIGNAVVPQIVELIGRCILATARNVRTK